MEYVRKVFRRVKNRIVNRPSAVQKRYYLKLRAQLDPLRKAERFRAEPPGADDLRHHDARTGIFCNLLAFLRCGFCAAHGLYPGDRHAERRKPYLEDELLGKVNAYEYFYRQPAGIGVEEGYRARSCISSTGSIVRMISRGRRKKAYREATRIVDWVYGENREKYFDRIKAIYDRYFVPSDEAAAFVDARFRELIAPGSGRSACSAAGRIISPNARISTRFSRPSRRSSRRRTRRWRRTRSIRSSSRRRTRRRRAEGEIRREARHVECPRLTAVQGQSVAEGFAERGVDRKLNGLYFAHCHPRPVRPPDRGQDDGDPVHPHHARYAV